MSCVWLYTGVTSPYNADFDGDEMKSVFCAHAPSSKGLQSDRD